LSEAAFRHAAERLADTVEDFLFVEGGADADKLRAAWQNYVNVADANTPPDPFRRVCGDVSGPNGVGGECVLHPGHPHVDGIGGVWDRD